MAQQTMMARRNDDHHHHHPNRNSHHAPARVLYRFTSFERRTAHINFSVACDNYLPNFLTRTCYLSLLLSAARPGSVTVLACVQPLTHLDTFFIVLTLRTIVIQIRL